MADENQGGTGDGSGDAAAAAAAASAAAGAGSGDQGAAGGAGAGGDAAAVAAAAKAGAKDSGWGETWRQTYVDGKKDLTDEDKGKLLKRLERYPSLTAALDGGISAQNRISESGLKKPLTGKETPEQLTEYRKENGIPETPAGYLENLPQGLVIGDADKPLFEDFVKGLHGLNAPPAIAQYAVKWYNEFQEQQATKQLETDEVTRVAAEDVMRTEWGNDYRTNINAIQGLLDGAPKDVADSILSARANEDGKAIMSNPGVMRFFAHLAREINPFHTIVPGSGGNSGMSPQQEQQSILKVLREDRNSYNKDPVMQARLLELNAHIEKLNSRSAA